MFELKITADFAAAHRLQMVGEKCEGLHGHNWQVEVRVRGENLDEAGVLLDFGVLKAQLRTVLLNLDHKFLNELEVFADYPQPTSENIAVFIAKELQRALKSCPVRVHSVSAWESANACATYYP